METMRLNTISPAAGSCAGRKRIGRGIGSGFGKTAGRGHKGQRSRAGARRDKGFEGGQMPLQRRVPKRGFRSRLARRTLNLRVGDLNAIGDGVNTVDVDALRKAGLLSHKIKRVKIYNSGELTRGVTVRGIAVSAGARAQLAKNGGKVETVTVKKVAQKKRAAAAGATA